ncbi:MAG TPA: PAS domain S-box protein [Geobacteraceae bacterium]|nr:PAS domain S-box protein [Geobacteraceae bacterium]
MPFKKSSRFIFLYGCIAAGAISLTTLLSLAEIRRDAFRQATMLQESHIKTFRAFLEEKGNPIRVIDGRLLAGDYVVNGNFELPDRVKEIFGGTATIFMGDIRVSTNVLTEDGSRAIGTRLDGPTYQEVFVQGRPFRGEIRLFGVPYFAAYDPLRNERGEVVGALYVGVRQSDFLAMYNKIRVDAIAIHLILIGAFVLLAYLYLRNRKKAELALRESEQQLKLVLEGSSDALWDLRVNSDTDLTYDNRWAEMLGYQPTEMGRGADFWKRIIHPGDLQVMLEHYRQKTENHECRLQAECRMLSQSGAWRWVLLRGKVVAWNKQGRPVRITGTATDITQRKVAENALKRSEANYRAIFDASHDAIIVHAVGSGRIMDVNQRACEMFGYSREELLSLGGGVTAAEDFRYQRDAALDRMRRAPGGTSRAMQWKATSKGGHVFWVDVDLKKAVIEGEERLLEVVRDISGRMRAEAELRQSHRLLQIVFSSLNEALFLLEDDSKIVVECNTSAEIMFGYTRAELIGFSSKILHLDDETAETFNREASLACRQKGFYTTEYRMKRKDGDVFPTEHFCNPIPGDGSEPSLILYVVRDITERKRADEDRLRLEEQLRHAQKMEAVGQLAGGIAHDFNNILTAIIGYGHLVLMNMQSDNPSRRQVEQILAASERAAGLTQGLLAFSRKQESNPRPVDLNGIVRNMRKFLERIIGEEIEMNITLGQDSMTVLADTGQMEQVLMNLATNARDAMPDGGVLSIRTGILGRDQNLLNASCFSDASRFAFISVTDTGSGMDVKIQEKIYEPFFTTKEVGKGTGLGLSIAYGIIKQHNGYISVESREGRGTTFRVCLPIIESETTTAEIAKPLFLPYGQETILLAEDDEEVRMLGRFLLEECGHEVILAENGEDAVAKFTAHAERISLVILDVVMPKMNGKQAFEAIRSVRPEVKVLFMSGYTEEIVNAKGVLKDGGDFIEKPIIPKTFLKKVRQVLDGNVGG